MNLYNFPRFGESDFETIINSLGGNKISETENRTPAPQSVLSNR